MTDTRTAAELARAVLEDFGLIEAEEDLDDGDQEMITRRYTNIMAEMRDDKVSPVYWENDTIPQEVFEPLVGLMRLIVGPSFGIPGLVGEDLDNAMQGAKRRIKRHTAKPSAGGPSPTSYY